jgi:hypothetical protein
MWMMVKEGGWGAMLAVLFGSLGIILGIVSLGLLAISRKVAHAMGVVTLGFALLAPMVGVLGMASGRRMTDGALHGESVGPGTKIRIRHEGYRESQSSARVGFYAGLLPLLLGATAAFLGARKKPEDPPSSLRWAFAGVAGAFAFLTSGGALAVSAGPLPPDMSMEEARLLDARAEIDDHVGNGCHELERTLNDSYWHPTDRTEWPRQFSPDPHKLVPDFDAIATKCARQLKSEGRSDELLTSPLLVDEALKKDLEQPPVAVLPTHDAHTDFSAGPFGTPLGRLSPNPSSTTTKSPTLRQGTTMVNGRLPPEVIQRIVRQNFGRFRLCYENGLRSNPALEGTVSVKFVIGRDGAVSSTSDGGSDLPDQSVVSCVVRGFGNLSFPQPEGGIVVVTYPIIFKPGS